MTFNAAAKLYHRARPDYPAALFDELVRQAGLTPDAELVEVGCATGKASIPLAARGFRLTCVEIGSDLAAEARVNLAAYPDCEVVVAAFERWTPSPPRQFDLVFAATSWHWIDPASRYRRAFDLLKPCGHFAFWTSTHVIPPDGDPFFAQIQDVYEEIGEGRRPGEEFFVPVNLPDERADIEASGLFTDVTTTQFVWEITYTAQGYIDLLDTFSNHILMTRAQRARLYGAIRELLAQRPDGLLRRHWAARLHVARRRRPSEPGQ
jgi:SAM-dependent methyltransferase